MRDDVDEQVVDLARSFSHEPIELLLCGKRVGLHLQHGIHDQCAFFEGIGLGRWVIAAVDEHNARVVSGGYGDKLREDGWHMQEGIRKNYILRLDDNDDTDRCSMRSRAI